MNFTEIEIEHKKLFDNYLLKYNLQVSELTFTNLFIWRKKFNFLFAEIDGYLVVISVSLDREFSFMPIGEYKEDTFKIVVLQIVEYFRLKGWKLCFKKILKEQLDYFNGLNAGVTEIIEDRDNFDYVYLRQDLIHLSGKKYDGKRNHIKHIINNYELEYVELKAHNIDKCKEILSNWSQNMSSKSNDSHLEEELANLELINNFGVLNLKGSLIKVDNKFEAFTVGEKLNIDTAVIHIEKANTNIHGLYQYINQQFCEKEWHEMTFINREQDLGIEGLRRAKLSYNPIKLIEKYSVLIYCER